MKATFEDLRRDLETLFPRGFGDSEKELFRELKAMSLPHDFVQMYARRSPNKILEFGFFGLFRLSDLIDENIWEEPGETLYQMGFPIIGAAPDGKRYGLDMRRKNSVGEHDVLLIDPESACDPADPQSARQHMKCVANNLIEFLIRELGFFRKKSSAPNR